jgi:acetyltransferase-like isoleucine patch superfamily enzyme
MIHIGIEHSIVDRKYTRTIFEIKGKIEFQGNARIGCGSIIYVWETGYLTIGKEFRNSSKTTILCVKNIVFGNNCLLSWDILIMDTDFHNIRNDNNQIINNANDIIIGNDVWICCRSLILKGAMIKDGSVIGANTTVSKKLENMNSIYVGNPPKCIKQNIKWE